MTLVEFPPRKTLSVNPDGIPIRLRACQQWLPWRRGNARPDGRYQKVPFSAHTGDKADTTQPQNWCSFPRALWEYANKQYDGIGFAVTEGVPIVGIDLDHCRNPETGEISAWARTIIDRLRTYTEVSPSGTGVRLWLVGAIPADRHEGDVEVYSSGHFLTVTGHHLDGTPTSVEERRAEVAAWYAETFPTPEPLDSPAVESGQGVTLSDEDLIASARRGVSGAQFAALWAGDASGYGSPSDADKALCGMLAFWTGNDAERIDRLYRQSGLMREKWERADYRERTIRAAIRGTTSTYTGRKRQDRRILHPREWQQREESPAEREVMLRSVALGVKERVRAHINNQESKILVSGEAPGSGKSHATAELGNEGVDIAWIAERHAMVDSVEALKHYRHIQPPTAENCAQHELHRELARKGQNTWPIHRDGCGYGQQFRQEGSAVYQLAHVPTAYPARHAGVVVDELSLSSWILERTITRSDIETVLAAERLRMLSEAAEHTARQLLRAVWGVLADCESRKTVLHSKALFDTLNDHCLGQLAYWVGTLIQDEAAVDVRPTPSIDAGDEDAVDRAKALPPLVLPYLVRALHAELGKWRQGGEWNSAMRMGRSETRDAWSCVVLSPRRFSFGEGEYRPLSILDGTADKELLKLLLGKEVEVVREHVDPPPRMRHIGVRTGKRYSKTSLTHGISNQRNRAMVLRELLYLLRELDPTGEERAAGRVGLITYDDIEQWLRDSLGIPKGRSLHFFAARGSNALKDCPVLLVVGTPTPNLDAVEWWARLLWRDDPKPIVTASRKVDGVWRYDDDRMQRLVDHLVRAELSQCAHRNRPLRYDGRIVVTLCQGEIDDLPITEEIIELPQLRDAGERHEVARQAEINDRLWRAAERILARGEEPSVRKMMKEDGLIRPEETRGIRTEDVARWLREWRAAGIDEGVSVSA